MIYNNNDDQNAINFVYIVKCVHIALSDMIENKDICFSRIYMRLHAVI